MTTAVRPQPATLGLDPSFGFGDRLGLATPGHLAALIDAGGPIRGIVAQQSIREMARTDRQPAEVMTAAIDALESAGFDDSWGADADHLKTHEDVDRTLAVGFTFFTIDPSEHVDQRADSYDAAELDALFESAKHDAPWHADYLGKTFEVPNGPAIAFDEPTVRRAVVKYGRAIDNAVEMAHYITAAAEKAGKTAELEISVDETDQPTTVAEHYLIADQLRQRGVKVVSLAPRFIGELEKGVDYKGDLAALEATMIDHAAIADHLGPYKLSLHSGSDKLSMYRLFGRCTKGRLHVKTAGTSYLEAVRVVARHDADLFARIIDFSRGRYDTDKATYHVSATVEGVPAPADLPDVAAMEQAYLQTWDTVPEGRGFTAPGRQILHCTFGSVLTHPEFGPALRQVLIDHPDTHRGILADHFARHLRELNKGIDEAA
ncbi:MAG: tagaturonate epimerase family protein [Planctomycetota bacterium]